MIKIEVEIAKKEKNVECRIRNNFDAKKKIIFKKNVQNHHLNNLQKKNVHPNKKKYVHYHHPIYRYSNVFFSLASFFLNQDTRSKNKKK